MAPKEQTRTFATLNLPEEDYRVYETEGLVVECAGEPAEFPEPENLTVLFHDKACDPLTEPVVEGVLVGGGFFEVVGVTTLDYLAENREHLGKVVGRGILHYTSRPSRPLSLPRTCSGVILDPGADGDRGRDPCFLFLHIPSL